MGVDTSGTARAKAAGMKLSSLTLLALLSFPFAAGCIAAPDDSDDPTEEVGEAEEALSALDWTALQGLGRSAQWGLFGVGTVGDKSVLVYPSTASFELRYAVRDTTNGQYGAAIPLLGSVSDLPPSLTAYNGKLVMAIRKRSLTTAGGVVAVRSYDPPSGTWTAQTSLALPVSSAPSLVSFGPHLYVFARSTSGQAVYARMDSSGTWTAPSTVPTPAQVTAVNATVFDSKILLTYVDSAGLKTQSFDGASWSAAEVVGGAIEAGAIWGVPTTVSFGNMVHLVVADSANGLWWSYKTAGGTWPSMTTIAPPSSSGPRLTANAKGIEVTFVAPSNELSRITYTPPINLISSEILTPSYHK